MQLNIHRFFHLSSHRDKTQDKIKNDKQRLNPSEQKKKFSKTCISKEIQIIHNTDPPPPFPPHNTREKRTQLHLCSDTCMLSYRGSMLGQFTGCEGKFYFWSNSNPFVRGREGRGRGVQYMYVQHRLSQCTFSFPKSCIVGCSQNPCNTFLLTILYL